MAARDGRKLDQILNRIYDENPNSDRNEAGESIAWNRIHDKLYPLVDEMLGQKALTLTDLVWQAESVAVAGSCGDPTFALIEAHKAAVAEEKEALTQEHELEMAIPKDRRRGETRCFEVTEVSTDDPRWTAVYHRYNDATVTADEIAMRMLDDAPVTLSGVTALLRCCAVRRGGVFVPR